MKVGAQNLPLGLAAGTRSPFLQVKGPGEWAPGG